MQHPEPTPFTVEHETCEQTLARFKAMFDNTVHLLGLLDPQGHMLEANRAVLASIGWAGEAIFGRPLWESPLFSHDPALQRQLKEGIKQAAAGHPVRFEADHPRPDGSWFRVDFSLSPVKDAAGTVRYLVPEGRDITEKHRMSLELAEANARLRAQKELIEAEAERRAKAHAESESRFRAIFDQTFQFIGILDATGHVLEINRTALESVGVRLEQIKGKPFHETPWWTHSPSAQARLKQAIAVAAAGGFDRFESTHPLADGRTIEVDFSIKPFKDESGEVVMLIPEGRDITVRKELEAELRAQFEQLKALDMLKNNFVNAVTHELRTPLATIVGYSEFLEDEIGGPLGRDQKAYVEEIIRAAGRLEHLVNDLLDFARMDAGTFRLNTAPLDLRDQIARAVRSLRPQAQDHGVSIRMELPAQALTVSVDPLRIAQVLSNLLHNALKFAPRGTEVRVTAIREGDFARCAIADRGEGIPLSEQPRLFQRFQQLTAGLREGKGSGLGLSISKALIEAHGGRIWAESEPGAGSTFSFELPVAPDSAAIAQDVAGTGR
ncbi:MAG TPA: PAS domain-containing sensor histidine kinase [Pantanalinema sp.]